MYIYISQQNEVTDYASRYDVSLRTQPISIVIDEYFDCLMTAISHTKAPTHYSLFLQSSWRAVDWRQSHCRHSASRLKAFFIHSFRNQNATSIPRQAPNAIFIALAPRASLWRPVSPPGMPRDPQRIAKPAMTSLSGVAPDNAAIIAGRSTCWGEQVCGLSACVS